MQLSPSEGDTKARCIRESDIQNRICTLIFDLQVSTLIGYGSPNKADTHDVHGAPLGKDETAATRENLKWSYGEFEVLTQPTFLYSQHMYHTCCLATLSFPPKVLSFEV